MSTSLYPSIANATTSRRRVVVKRMHEAKTSKAGANVTRRAIPRSKTHKNLSL